MPLSGEAIRLMNYIDDVAVTLRRLLAAAPTLSPEERQEVAPFRIPRFHRTLGAWVDLIRGAGLVIERFAEPSAGADLARAEPVVADTRVVPIFLIVRATRPA